jgi:hypothetical protein
MFKTLLSTVLGFVTGGSTTVYLVAGALLLGAYGGYAVTDNHYKAKLAQVNQEAFDHTTAVIEQQAVISQNTQKEKDELQTRYDGVVNMLRGMHNSSVSTNSNTSFTISSKGLRLLEPDAEVLIGFARQCESTEIERNDVIQKYNALKVK